MSNSQQNNEIRIIATCVFCRRKTETTASVEPGWVHNYGEIWDEDNWLCPDHAIIHEFRKSQCPGCVSSWGECPLFKAFAFRALSLSDLELDVIRKGVCPRRINGTFSYSKQGIEPLNLSEKAPDEAGNALSKAIVQYGTLFYENKK